MRQITFSPTIPEIIFNLADKYPNNYHNSWILYAEITCLLLLLRIKFKIVFFKFLLFPKYLVLISQLTEVLSFWLIIIFQAKIKIEKMKYLNRTNSWFSNPSFSLCTLISISLHSIVSVWTVYYTYIRSTARINYDKAYTYIYVSRCT